MFDIGFQELVVIFVIALLVFGPKRLPEVSRTLGKWIGELRKGIYDVRMQMQSEIDEMRDETREETEKKQVEGGDPETRPEGKEHEEGPGEGDGGKA